MFEREIYGSNLSNISNAEGIESNFVNPVEVFSARSFMNWAEHCSECVMPQCFTSCSFYTPRKDMKCNRFEGGIKVVADNKTKSILDVEFKHWGKLEAVGANRIPALRVGNFFNLVDRSLLSKLSGKDGIFYQLKRTIARKVYGLKNRFSKTVGSCHVYEMDAFFMEFFNPEKEDAALNLTFRNTLNANQFFQKAIQVPQGYSKHKIPVQQIAGRVNLNEEFICSFEALAEGSHTRVLFGVLDFVKFLQNVTTDTGTVQVGVSAVEKLKKVKCVVWDLDHTLWDGILIEDGIDNLKIKSEVVDFIKDLDSKGILNSIASKNNEADALAAIEKFGLQEMFLYPQISWGPKSVAIGKIQKSLNIGMDTFVFIDDQVFEREEVQSAHPKIRALDIADIGNWKKDSSFEVEVTTESGNRRQMYRDQIVREGHFETQGDEGTYIDFLKDCKIKVHLEELTESTIPRAYELAQRTNQMNFSGNRYSMEILRDFLKNRQKEVSIVRCSDRFGDYGIVGLVIFDNSNKAIQDLMFSCRIQSKYVDHAVLADFAERYQKELKIEYKETEKNAKSSSIFSDLGFELQNVVNGVQTLSWEGSAEDIKNEIVELNHVQH